MSNLILKNKQDNKPTRNDFTGSQSHLVSGSRLYRTIRCWVLSNKFLLTIYVASHALFLLIAVVNAFLQHSHLSSELSNWDGVWYIRLASRGYPKHPLHYQTTLGFLPFYSMLMWLVARLMAGNLLIAGLVINFIGGLISTILLDKLVTGWTDKNISRRAVVLYCFFPGAIIFSMVYSEGILIPLIMGALLLVQKRKYLLAGILGFFATATAPDALAIIPVFFVAFLYELKKEPKQTRREKRALGAIAISLAGISLFGIALWIWTGTPLAAYNAQHYGVERKHNSFGSLRPG